MSSRDGSRQQGDKQFFKIGEVAEIVGVKAHVLRYWEGEFGVLKPMKTRGAHRMYRRSDVELACCIRRLVQEDGYTISGAKKRLKELRAGDGQGGERQAAGREVALRAELLAVRAELQGTLDDLAKAVDKKRPPSAQKVTVTSAVQAPVPVRTRRPR